MRANRVLIGAIAVVAIDLALVFALFGMDGDPPDAFVIVATLVFWTAVLVAAVAIVLAVRAR
ncbi:MAG: hypothetical protein M3N47_00455, partial [Chloroflexota bacterium]|nr:hypothetical protein [Chloroflexota bacterium]